MPHRPGYLVLCCQTLVNNRSTVNELVPGAAECILEVFPDRVWKAVRCVCYFMRLHLVVCTFDRVKYLDDSLNFTKLRLICSFITAMGCACDLDGHAYNYREPLARPRSSGFSVSFSVSFSEMDERGNPQEIEPRPDGNKL